MERKYSLVAFATFVLFALTFCFQSVYAEIVKLHFVPLSEISSLAHAKFDKVPIDRYVQAIVGNPYLYTNPNVSSSSPLTFKLEHAVEEKSTHISHLQYIQFHKATGSPYSAQLLELHVQLSDDNQTVQSIVVDGQFEDSPITNLAANAAPRYTGAQILAFAKQHFMSSQNSVARDWMINDKMSRVEKVMYVDGHGQQHLAYRVDFSANSTHSQAQTSIVQPGYIIDANTQAILKSWDSFNGLKISRPDLKPLKNMLVGLQPHFINRSMSQRKDRVSTPEMRKAIEAKLHTQVEKLRALSAHNSASNTNPYLVDAEGGGGTLKTNQIYDPQTGQFVENLANEPPYQRYFGSHPILGDPNWQWENAVQLDPFKVTYDPSTGICTTKTPDLEVMNMHNLSGWTEFLPITKVRASDFPAFEYSCSSAHHYRQDTADNGILGPHCWDPVSPSGGGFVSPCNWSFFDTSPIPYSGSNPFDPYPFDGRFDPPNTMNGEYSIINELSYAGQKSMAMYRDLFQNDFAGDPWGNILPIRLYGHVNLSDSLQNNVIAFSSPYFVYSQYSDKLERSIYVSNQLKNTTGDVDSVLFYAASSYFGTVEHEFTHTFLHLYNPELWLAYRTPMGQLLTETVSYLSEVPFEKWLSQHSGSTIPWPVKWNYGNALIRDWPIGNPRTFGGPSIFQPGVPLFRHDLINGQDLQFSYFYVFPSFLEPHGLELINTVSATGIFRYAMYRICKRWNQPIYPADENTDTEALNYLIPVYKLFVYAYIDYWNHTNDFNDAACGVLRTAVTHQGRDPNYTPENVFHVIEAFSDVGIHISLATSANSSTGSCGISNSVLQKLQAYQLKMKKRTH